MCTGIFILKMAFLGFSVVMRFAAHEEREQLKKEE